jgi:hypothetical protein
MDQVNFTGAIMNGTILADEDLSRCVGLETVEHQGPSSIGFDTLARSFYACEFKFTSEMKVFFYKRGYSDRAS